MKLLLLSIIMLLNFAAKAQFSAIDKAFQKIEFNEKEQAIESAFKWVANNISYDIEQLNRIIADKNALAKTKESIINNVLQNKKGVCEHYATLFAAFLDKLNIQNQLVSGYIKNTEGIVEQDIGHLWITAFIDGKWELFDPTWASGYIDIQTKQFVKKYDHKWFKISPHLLIQTHYPYDPIFQLLNEPKTAEEFYHGAILNFEKPFLDFNRHLDEYLQMNELNQLQATKSRMENRGIVTKLEIEYLDYLSKSISVYQYNEQVNIENYNISQTNIQIDKMNRIIEQLNQLKHQFVNDVNSYQGKTITRNLKTKLRLLCNNAEQNVINLNTQLKSIKTNDERFLNTLNENLAVNQEFLDKIEDYRNGL